MPRLLNRQLQIPYGMTFYLPALKWTPKPAKGASFNQICDQLEAVIKANPAMAAQNKWPKTKPEIENWVDFYNATLCEKMGWEGYTLGEEAAGLSLPKVLSPSQRESLKNLTAAAERAKELIAGARSLIEWDDSGEEAVPAETSASRAEVCAKCPLNSSEDLTKWFTVPAAELIKRRIERAQSRRLTTPKDDLLHLCTACHCPLKLKVHVPIAWVRKRLTDEQKARLDTSCWILHEP